MIVSTTEGRPEQYLKVFVPYILMYVPDRSVFFVEKNEFCDKIWFIV